ncbi:MAG TPA: HAD family phosphatase [Gemmataceae bacterium]|jgi:beta-phosphoglucomutase|nr:HAD family phosphatase [Gemmataceae bacterium]
MTNNIQAVLWDVDGTLVDTAELHFEAWCALAQELNKPFTRADFAGTFGWRNPEIIPRLFGAHYSADEIAALGNRKEDLYRAEARKGVALLPGVRSLLEGLHQAGVRQAIGSSAPRANIDMILDLTETRAFLPVVVAMEDTERGKPDPEVFLIGARRLGVAPDRCLVLEDAPVGIQAAKAGGMRAVGVTFVGHHSAESLGRAGADLVVASLATVTPGLVQGIIGG